MSLESQFNFVPLSSPILITEQEWPEGTLPLVHTRTMTFNQENYVRECIEGILMQKTTFPVEILIHDDASTDKTSKIIREYELKYPKLIKTYYQKENSHTKPDKHKRREVFMNFRLGKYEAICEGDDYWTDPLKLQKQTDYLEKNKSVGLVYTKVRCSNNNEIIGGQMIGNAIFYQNKIPTLSTLYRLDLKKEYLRDVKPEDKNWKMGDYPTWLWFYINSKVSFIDEVTAVYRVLPQSASHFTDGNKRVLFNFSSYNIAKFFAKSNMKEAEYDLFLNKRISFLAKSTIKHRSLLILKLKPELDEIRNKTFFNTLISLLIKLISNFK